MAQVRKATESISDEAMKSATGFPLEHWMQVLDCFDLHAKGHTAAARHLAETHNVSKWWSQQITVTYEQERGLRQPGQRPNGTFTVNASKTIASTIEKAYEAFSTAEGWNRWFTSGASIDLQVGGSYSNNDNDRGTFTRIIAPGPLRSMNERARLTMTWENPDHCSGTKVTVQFLEKSSQKCTVVITHDNICSQSDCDEMKEGWIWALSSLKSYIENDKPISFEEWKLLQESGNHPAK